MAAKKLEAVAVLQLLEGPSSGDLRIASFTFAWDLSPILLVTPIRVKVAEYLTG